MVENIKAKKVTRKKKKAKKRKKVSQAAKSNVERSYPPVTLVQALRIPLAIKDKNGGNPWLSDDLATAVGLSKKGNNFFYLAKAARDFGLTDGGRDTEKIGLTKLGKDVVYPANEVEELNAKKKAFLNVDVFRRVLEHYQGSNLPEMKYLSNTLNKEFGLAEKHHEEFSDLFKRNCRYLGLQSGSSSTDTTDIVKGDVKFRTKSLSIVTLAENPDKKSPNCFVILPFSEREDVHPSGYFTEVLESLIVPAAREAGFTVNTANRAGSDVIQATIVNNLWDAELVLADLTENNPNVLFELGVRMAADKPVALIRSKGTTQIFDVDNMLRVFDYNPCLWKTTVEADLPNLVEHIKAVWQSKDSDQTYMKILRNANNTQ